MSQSAAQAAAFFAEVVRTQIVWTVRDDGGYAAPVSTSGARSMPFWSSEERVRRIIANVPAYSGFQPDSIDLAAWRERWLPGLERDGILVGLNWTGDRATGYDVEPAAALVRLAHAVGEGPG
jgi:hypothetical protein